MGSFSDCLSKAGLLPDEVQGIVQGIKDLRSLSGEDPKFADPNSNRTLMLAAVTDLVDNATAEHQSLRDELTQLMQAGRIPLVLPEAVRKQMESSSSQGIQQVKKFWQSELTRPGITPAEKSVVEQKLQILDTMGPEAILEQFWIPQPHTTGKVAALGNTLKGRSTIGFGPGSVSETQQRNFWKLKSDVPLSDVTVPARNLGPTYKRQFDPGSPEYLALENVLAATSDADKEARYQEFLDRGFRVTPLGRETEVRYIGKAPLESVLEPTFARPMDVEPGPAMGSQSHKDSVWQHRQAMGSENTYRSRAMGVRGSSARAGSNLQNISLGDPATLPRGEVMLAKLGYTGTSPQHQEWARFMEVGSKMLDHLVKRMMPNAKVVISDRGIETFSTNSGGHFCWYSPDVYVIEINPHTMASVPMLRKLSVVFHEFGHAFTYYAFRNLSWDKQWAIYQDYRKALKSMTAARMEEGNPWWRFAVGRSAAEWAVDLEYHPPFDRVNPDWDYDYWYGFDEWMAESIARWGSEWLRSGRAPVSQTFFASMKQKIENAIRILTQWIQRVPEFSSVKAADVEKMFSPSENVKQWMETAYNGAGVPAILPNQSLIEGIAIDEGAIVQPVEAREVMDDPTRPIYYSTVKAAAETFPQDRATGDQWFAWISKTSKKEEREWMGLKDFLQGKPSVTREEVESYIAGHEAKVTVTRLSDADTQYERYVEPWRTDFSTYKEMLIHLIPKVGPLTDEAKDQIIANKYFIIRSPTYTFRTRWEILERLTNLPPIPGPTGELEDQTKRVTFKTFESREEARDWLFRHGPEKHLAQTYEAPHYTRDSLNKNLLAHARFDVRIVNGKRTLFIQEIQSDWHQEGRKHGYKGHIAEKLPTREEKDAAYDVLMDLAEKYGEDSLRHPDMDWWMSWDPLFQRFSPEDIAALKEANRKTYLPTSLGEDRRGVLDAPFKTTGTWSMLAFKAVLRWAVDSGFEQIAWTTGETQEKRYRQEFIREVGKVSWKTHKGLTGSRGTKELNFENTNLQRLIVDAKGVVIAGPSAFNYRLLPDLIGKELATRIMVEKTGQTGEEVKIAEQGQTGFYDKILPAEVQKYVKKWGAKVEKGKADLLQVGEYWKEQKSNKKRYMVVLNPFYQDEPVGFQPGDPEPSMNEVYAWADTIEEAEKYVEEVKKRFPGWDIIWEENTNWAPGGEIDAWVVPITREMEAGGMQPQPIASTALPKNARAWQAIESDAPPPAAPATPQPVAYNAFEPNDRIRARTLVDKWHWYTKYGENLMQVFQQNLHITGLVHYVERVMQWARDKGAVHAKANENVRFIEKNLSKDQVQRVGEFLFEYNALDRIPSQAELLQMYQRAGLDANGIEAAQRVIAHYLDYLNQLEAALLIAADQDIEDVPRREAHKANIRAEMQMLRDKPYVPQTRFTRINRYTVVVKARRQMVYEGRSLRPGDTARMEAFYTEREQRARAAELRGQFTEPEFVVAERYIPDELNAFRGIPPAFIDHLKDKLGLSPDQLAILDEIKFETSASQSHKRHFMRRKDIPGYSTDWLRAYAEYFFYGANHLARARWSGELESAIREVKTEADVIANAGGSTVMRDKLWDFLKTHKEYILFPKNELDSLRAFGFIWYLGFVPRAALVNLTQVPFVAFPWLAARFGDGKSVVALTKSFKDVRKMFSQDARGMDPGFGRALGEAVKAGFVDESNAADLAAYVDYSAMIRAMGGTKIEKTLRSTSMAAAWMFHQAERWNRRHVFKAAYDLAMRDLENPKIQDILDAHREEIARLQGQGFSEAEAKAYMVARAAVMGSQYEYAKWNRPRAMQGKRSIIFLFMNFLQNTLWFMKNDPGGLRALVILGAAAGLQGLPGADDLVSVLRALYRKWTGKDINPWREVREFAAGLGLNPELALHGFGRYTLGLASEVSGIPIPALDLSGSFSMGRIIPGLSALGPPGDYKDKFMSAATDVGGAAIAIPLAIAQALSDDNPDWQKRWERAMPTALRGVSRWDRYMTDQAETTSTGAEVVKFDPMDPMHNAEVAMTALGFPPTRVTAMWEQSRMEMELARYWVGRRTNLARAYDYAVERKDREVLADVKQQIREYNSEAPSAKLKITQDYLQESRKRREKARKDREKGLPRAHGLQRESQAIRGLFAPPGAM